MPNSKEKGKYNDHHGPHEPKAIHPEDEHDILKRNPYPLTSRPKQTFIKKDPIKNTPRKG